jgi:hypothetical protein
MRRGKTAKRGGRRLYGNATVSIQQDPMSPTMLVDYETAQNVFEDRDPRITGGVLRTGRKRRTRKHRKNLK